jgi:hypothetical protein
VRAREERFADALREKRLIIVNAAIWSQATTQPFYVNLDNDHWSSLDPAWAGRENSRTQAVEVECVPIAHLFARYGVPFYLKIDVEGADELVLDSLVELPELPFYLSLEDCRFGYRYMKNWQPWATGRSSFWISHSWTDAWTTRSNTASTPAAPARSARSCPASGWGTRRSRSATARRCVTARAIARRRAPTGGTSTAAPAPRCGGARSGLAGRIGRW